MPYTFNDDAIALVDSNLNQVAVSQSQIITPVSQSGFIMAGVSGSTTTFLKVTTEGVVFVTGSVALDSAVSIGTVTQGPSGSVPWLITGSVTINNPSSVTIGAVNQGTSGSEYWKVTGSVVISEIVTVTGSTTINNFPVTQSVKIDQSIILPVSVSNFPTIQIITGAISLSETATITGSVTINNPVSTINQGVSGSTSWLVTGSFFQVNQPVTQSVKIDQSITLPVSVSNFPATQTITGSVDVNGLVFVSGSNLSVFITSSNTLPITGTVLSLPFGTQTITGTINVDNSMLPVSVSNFPSVQIVTGTVLSLPFGTQTIDGTVTSNQGTSGSQFWKVTGSVSITEIVTITGSTTINNFPVTQSVRIVAVGTDVTQSITGSVTINGPLTVSQGISGSQFWKVTGSVDITNYPVTQSVKLVDVGTNVTQSVTGTITANQGVQANISNAWPIILSNGVITASVVAPYTAASASHNALVVAISPNNIIKIAPSDPLGVPQWGTPFGELRVASVYTLADLVNKYEIDIRTYSSQSVSNGTVAHVPAESAIRVAVPATSGSVSKLRTNTYFRHQAGKSLRWRTTVYNNDVGVANQVRQWGFFDENDGLFFELNATTLYIVQRSSTSGVVADTKIERSLWNVDTMDGTGPSRIILDITKGNIYECAFQWLGVGSVYYFVDGYLVHLISNANTLSAPYMASGQLPMSWQITNTGASTASNFTYICASVFVEGGDESQQTAYSTYVANPILVSTTERPVLSIRPKATYNGITNRMLILPFLASISTEGSRAGFRIVIESTLTGASWTSVDQYSGVEFDVSATSGSGGFTLMRGFLPNSNDAKDVDLHTFFSDKAFARSLRLDAFATTQEVLTIYAVNEGAGNTQIRSTIAWNEVR